jgi:beta-galactosidase/beta-glucuronidase
MKFPNSHIDQHPRPQLTRPSFMLLDGVWDFAFDDEDQGIKQQWFSRWEKNRSIIVPFSYQTRMSTIHDTHHHEIIWYHLTFEYCTQETTLLHLEKSDDETMVWVNGIFIGKNIGGYHRITMDISHALREGQNDLTIRVHDSWDTMQPRGKQRWKKESFGCWYVETNGIYQSVWLEAVPKTYLKHVILTPDVEKMLLNVDYDVQLHHEHTMMEIEILFEGQLIQKVSQLIMHEQGHLTLEMKTDQDQFKLMTWHADHPHLYDLILRLKHHDVIVDEAKSYVGMRQWKSVGRALYLNDEPVYLKMLLDQGYWPESGLTAPSQDALLSDLILTKRMGYNGIRKHQKIEDERFYYYADVLGLYVWLEMPSAYEFSQKMMKRVTDEWLSILQQHRHYSSIMTYVLFNESWGLHHIMHDQDQQRFSVALYHLTKSMDPTRFVISNDGWEHTISDLITIHNYVSSGDVLNKMYQDVIGLMNHQVANQTKVRSIFAEGYHDMGQPIIFSEYGGVAFQSDEGWGYGDKVQTKEAFRQRLFDLTHAIMQHPLFSGYCLTQTTDVEQEVNGVMNPKRELKLTYEEYLAINGVK